MGLNQVHFYNYGMNFTNLIRRNITVSSWVYLSCDESYDEGHVICVTSIFIYLYRYFERHKLCRWTLLSKLVPENLIHRNNLTLNTTLSTRLTYYTPYYTTLFIYATNYNIFDNITHVFFAKCNNL